MLMSLNCPEWPHPTHTLPMGPGVYLQLRPEHPFPPIELCCECLQPLSLALSPAAPAWIWLAFCHDCGGRDLGDLALLVAFRYAGGEGVAGVGVVLGSPLHSGAA